MDWQQAYASKVVGAGEAVGKIKRGSRVFIGTGCGEPQQLIKAMISEQSLQDIMIYQMLSFTLSRFVGDPSFHKRFSLKLFFISRSMRKAAFEGKIDYIPVYLSQIPSLFTSQRIGLDVALVQVSPPDKYGYCSLGVSVDITRAGLDCARLVIAQVNSRMPRTWGDSFIHVDEIDWLVDCDEQLVQSSPPSRTTRCHGVSGITCPNWWTMGRPCRSASGTCPFTSCSTSTAKRISGCTPR